MITRQISVRGRVQGVGFRDALQREARRLGVTGWVRNRTDGSVEAVLQGSPEAVEKIIVWARRGPRAALVAADRTGLPESGARAALRSAGHTSEIQSRFEPVCRLVLDKRRLSNDPYCYDLVQAASYRG